MDAKQVHDQIVEKMKAEFPKVTFEDTTSAYTVGNIGKTLYFVITYDALEVSLSRGHKGFYVDLEGAHRDSWETNHWTTGAEPDWASLEAWCQVIRSFLEREAEAFMQATLRPPKPIEVTRKDFLFNGGLNLLVGSPFARKSQVAKDLAIIFDPKRALVIPEDPMTWLNAGFYSLTFLHSQSEKNLTDLLTEARESRYPYDLVIVENVGVSKVLPMKGGEVDWARVHQLAVTYNLTILVTKQEARVDTDQQTINDLIHTSAVLRVDQNEPNVVEVIKHRILNQGKYPF